MEKKILMGLWLGISELEFAKTILNWRLMLREWSSKAGKEGDLCFIQNHKLVEMEKYLL